jgi:carbon storage regulator
MLLLQRRDGDTVHIGEHITVRVMACHGGRVTLGFEAPADVLILRGELRDRADAATAEVVDE